MRRGRPTRARLLTGLLLAGLLGGVGLGKQHGEKKRTEPMDYNTAVARLQGPSTWCEGAEALVARGDQRAVVPLAQAYQTPIEGSKQCLFQALKAFARRPLIDELYDRNGPDERQAAVLLMELFPDEAYLPRLEKAIADANDRVRLRARSAVACQPRTAPWEAAMIRLLGSADEAARSQAIESLSQHDSEAARRALRAHLSQETSETLRTAIRKAIGQKTAP